MQKIAICLALGLAASSAQSAPVTVAFDNDFLGPLPDNETAASDGFLFETSTTYPGVDHLYLHDDAGPMTSDIRAETGERFTATSIDILTYARIYRTGAASNDPDLDIDAWAHGASDLLPTFTLAGYRDGLEVASMVFPTQNTASNGAALGSYITMALSADFANLDVLTAHLRLPQGLMTAFDGSALDPETDWCEEWCGGFKIDNLVVSTSQTPASVPLPATLPLLAASIALLFGRIRRRD